MLLVSLSSVRRREGENIEEEEQEREVPHPGVASDVEDQKREEHGHQWQYPPLPHLQACPPPPCRPPAPLSVSLVLIRGGICYPAVVVHAWVSAGCVVAPEEDMTGKGVAQCDLNY